MNRHQKGSIVTDLELRIMREVSAAGGTVGFDDESAEAQAQAEDLINRKLMRGQIMAGGGVIAYGLTNAGQAALSAVD